MLLEDNTKYDELDIRNYFENTKNDESLYSVDEFNAVTTNV